MLFPLPTAPNSRNKINQEPVYCWSWPTELRVTKKLPVKESWLINAGLRALGKEPYVMKRSEGYIGVMIDDLRLRTNEPTALTSRRNTA